jgi:NADPH:quinone reductase
MKAALIRENGPPSVLSYEDVPDPVLQPDGVLIRVEAISLEGGDMLNRKMLPPASFPHIVGYQAAGTVEAVGPQVSKIRVGQRVAGFSFAGSHAELFAVPEYHAFPIPDGLDIAVAATIPVTFGTADEALFEFAKLKAGETVLIQGGAGGVGLAAIQLAKAVGATVIATAFGEARAQALKQYGADHGIAYDQGDIADAVLAITDGKGADLVVDMAGGKSLATLLRAVAYRGRLATVGFSSGELPSLGFFELISKNLTVYGVLFGLEMPTPRAHAMIERHMQAALAGKITMPIDRTFLLSDIVSAHDYAERSRPFGRVIIKP